MSDAVVDHSKKVIDDLDSLLSHLHCESAKRRDIIFTSSNWGPGSGCSSSVNSDELSVSILHSQSPSHRNKERAAPGHKKNGTSTTGDNSRPHSYKRDTADTDDRRGSTAHELDSLLQELSQAKRYSSAKKTAAFFEGSDNKPLTDQALDPKKNSEILNRTAFLSLSPSQLSNESKANVENLLAELHNVIRASPSKLRNHQVNPNFASYTTPSIHNSMPVQVRPDVGQNSAIGNDFNRYAKPYSAQQDFDHGKRKGPDVPNMLEESEIDELYSSISEVAEKCPHPPPPPRTALARLPLQVTTNNGGGGGENIQRLNLDRMLGDLEKDLHVEYGSSDPYSFGGSERYRDSKANETLLCAHCKEVILDQSISALGKNWHLEHFVCAECRQELGTKNFFEYEGKPFCEEDYHRLFSPKCAHCSLPILEKCVTALDQTWHPEHFCCAKCERLFAPNEGFHEVEGKPYCREDYFELFAPKCKACLNPIMENFISALQAHWHPDCFVCQDCHMPFGNGSFFEHGGWPCCETHYHSRRGSLCAGCGKPISSGKCVTALYKKFHPEHFVCAFCLKQLSATFKEQNDKPYCHSCFEKLFS